MANKKKVVIKFHKQLILQLYGYIVFIPYFFAFKSLQKEYNDIDLVIFISGIIFLAIILLVNHLDPVARVTSEKFYLYYSFKNRPVILNKKDYNSHKRVNRTLVLLTFGEKVYEIKLSSFEQKKFLSLLEEIN